MKEYIYNLTKPYMAIDTVGEKFELKQGDIVTLCGDRLYKCRDHKFALTRESLKRYFERIYHTCELDRYDRIRECAMIGAMQSLIICQNNKPISSDMHELENITTNAIWFADNLVNKLKDKEY